MSGAELRGPLIAAGRTTGVPDELRSVAFSAIKALSAAFDHFRPAHRGVVILLYHRVGARKEVQLDLPTDLFDRQMEDIGSRGNAVDLASGLDALENQHEPAHDPIVITFDDGTVDFVDVALPILVRHQVPATLYLATDHIERQVLFPHDGRPLSWSALRDALDTGLVTIGSHTHTHALLDRFPPSEAEAELRRSTALIEDRLGVSAEHFAYPKAVAPSPGTEKLVRRHFRSAALAGTRPNRYGITDLHRLARSPIQAADGLRWFERKLRGGMRLEDDLRRFINRRRYAGATS